MSQRIVILGGGESGVGTALLAKQKGYDVFLSDFDQIKDKYKEMLRQGGIAFEDGGHTEELILNADEVMKSPGIPDETPIVSRIISRNIPIISEIEFAARFTDAKMICITGSNGKTTTTSLIYYILSQAGLNVGLAGNIGRSLALQILDDPKDYYVIELSSFQLDNMYDFRAHIAVLMNITPDHLDRYQFEMQHYVDSKMRIIQNQTPADTFIYWAQDDHIDAELQRRQCSMLNAQWSMVNGQCIEPTTPSSRPARPGHPTLLPFRDEDFERLGLTFSQIGNHNKRNALAAYHAAKSLGIDEQVIRRCLDTFPGVEHRLERVAEIQGVTYINDSKATNVDACYVALEAVNTPIVLILGGKDKGNDYSVLHSIIRTKCRALVFMGADNSKLHEAFRSLDIPTADTHSMADAVRACHSFAQPGDTVLLSPCCASFDLFRNMEDRGEQFRDQVNLLT
ncbi:MAG: UDP-N-acetylmuramoyl-L-alanine--D-glutamate ligase [Bacteroidaceae bacterium]|nr:UDP-N-acetylmuramoyl-L-alanine--D-glutamate ligase [Bacteroidaceae bacterium]